MNNPSSPPFGADLIVDGGVAEAIQAGLEELARRNAARRAGRDDQCGSQSTEPDAMDAEEENPARSEEAARPQTNGSGAVAIFQSLFAGRRDAYGTTDPSNPSKGLCVREPLTDDVIARHLRGKIRIGVYLVRDDLTVSFGAVDFDGGEADLERALAYCEAAEVARLHPYLERSRGKGFHVWLFFSFPVPAAVVKRALRHLADQLGLPPSLEIFPKQDSLEGKEFGNYIYLPLNGRKQVDEGRTAFLDWEDGCQPFADPIAPLREVHYSEPEAVGRLASASEGARREHQEKREQEKTKSESKAGPAPSSDELKRLRPLYDAIRTKGVPAGAGALRHAAVLLVGYFLRQEGWPLNVAQVIARDINTRFQPPIDDFDLEHQIEDAYARGWLISSEHLRALKALVLAEDAASEPILETFSVDDELAWEALPEERFYVPDMIAAGHIAFIVAEPKTGKSLLSLDLGWALAQDRGGDWPVGRGNSSPNQLIVTGAKILFIACEDARSTVKARRRQFLKSYGSTGDRLAIAFGKTRPLQLWSPGDIEELMGYADRGYNVIIIDTLGAATGGRGDKDREEWAEQIEPSLRLLRQRGVTIILVEHVRKETGLEARRKKKLVKPSPHSLFGSVAKRALYGSALFLGETPWDRKLSVYVETKVSDKQLWFVIERAPMDEDEGWRHRYDETVAETKAELEEKRKEERQQKLRLLVETLRSCGRLTYAELESKLHCARSTLQALILQAVDEGLVVADGKKGRANAFVAVPTAEPGQQS